MSRIFSDAEVQRRWDGIWQRVSEADALIIPSFHNSFYVSGVPVIRYGRWAVTLLSRSGDVAMVVPEFELPAARRLSPISDVRSYRDDDGPTLDVVCGLVRGVLAEWGTQTIGIEADGMPLSMCTRLTQQPWTGSIVDISAAVDEVRSVSSDEEIAYLRRASAAADAGMAAVLRLLAAGSAEADLAAEATMTMQRYGDERSVVTGTSCYMQQDSRSIEGHARAWQTPVEAGSVMEVVCEAEIWHYMAGVERAIVIGEPSREAQRVLEACLAAFDSALAAVRPGATFADVHKAALRDFERRGLAKYVVMGSGLVRNILTTTGGRINGCDFRSYNERPLLPGMVVSVEPWAAVPGVGGFRYCDMVLVTENGQERLSTTEMGPIRVPVGTTS